ncbi:MAG TPA: helix-turn-helix domain-containing protein [Streptosporangiaceae bacterium]|nr:helix-turn-helix domain-containing protein [Streptosporangiaceae bacterium]
MNTRDRILDAAADVMRTRGFARATTKEIARAAGYSEPMIYKHFANKSRLFLAVLHERLEAFGPLAAELTRAPGERPPRDWLVATAGAAIAFYLESFPMSASMFADPDLLAAHRADMADAGAGPHRPVTAVAAYLQAEQDRGRISAAADCSAAADLLIGACFQYAFLCCFAGRQPTQGEIDTQAASAVGTLLAGIGNAAMEEGAAISEGAAD